MKKLVFRRPKPKKEPDKSITIKVSGEAYLILLEYKAELGESVCKIASRMIKYAAKNAVIEEDDE